MRKKKIKQNHYHMESQGAFKVSNPGLWCDQERRKLSRETRAEEVGFEVLTKKCNRWTVSHMKRERVPKDWGVVAEGIRKEFD